MARRRHRKNNKKKHKKSFKNSKGSKPSDIFFGISFGGIVITAVSMALLALIITLASKKTSAYVATTVSTTNASTQPSLSSKQSSLPLPAQALLNDNYYVPQTFNNCGPATLSMDLSFYGVNVSQEALADALRPDHNTTGKDDDKSTPPEEIAAQAEQYGLIAYYRPAGSIDLLKQLAAAGFPVIVRTLFTPSEPVAHYRVIKGYDDKSGTVIDEDGFQGPNVSYSYADFSTLWNYFNNEYIVLASPAQQTTVEKILGADINAATAWQTAAQQARQAIAQNPDDSVAQFNLSVALYHTGDYAGSAKAFEAAEADLFPPIPPDSLWYQMEPIESYYQLGQYDKVFSLSQQIFDNGNPAYPELYVLRGESYLKKGNPAAAKTEFETALAYNKNLQSAQDALNALTQ